MIWFRSILFVVVRISYIYISTLNKWIDKVGRVILSTSISLLYNILCSLLHYIWSKKCKKPTNNDSSWFLLNVLLKKPKFCQIFMMRWANEINVIFHIFRTFKIKSQFYFMNVYSLNDMIFFHHSLLKMKNYYYGS